MNILIHTKGVAFDDDLKQAIYTKIGRVRKYAPQALRARVVLHRTAIRWSTAQFIVRVHYEIPGHDLHAEHAAADALTALDAVAEKIERRLRKRKTARLAERLRSRPISSDIPTMGLEAIEGGVVFSGQRIPLRCARSL